MDMQARRLFCEILVDSVPFGGLYIHAPCAAVLPPLNQIMFFCREAIFKPTPRLVGSFVCSPCWCNQHDVELLGSANVCRGLLSSGRFWSPCHQTLDKPSWEEVPQNESSRVSAKLVIIVTREARLVIVVRRHRASMPSPWHVHGHCVTLRDTSKVFWMPHERAVDTP